MESKVRIFGHPIHPMVIGYPVAFYTGTLVAFAIYGANADRFWLKAAIAVSIAGAGMAIIAALPGFIDWLLAIPSGSPAKRTGLIHMGLNVVALGLFIVTSIVYARHWNTGAPSASLGIILSAIGVGATILAGFQGWKLVQDHHVGVRGMGETRTAADLRRAS
jgi:uncharacterized membrane protein